MKIGLDDIVAAETVLSDVDGEKGRLIIRGSYLDDLAGHSTYEEVLVRLFSGFFDELPAAPELQAALGLARIDVFDHLRFADHALLELEPVDAVRALIARINDGDDLRTALRLVAAPAVFTAGLIRLRQGRDLIAPDATRDHATDTLIMAGISASPEQKHALGTYLVTIVDHGLNASTFAARVVASTRAGLVSSVLAAISALKGPLHGGAPGPVLDTLDAIGHVERVEAWLDNAVNRGERLMGFGHRIYRVRDPRADALKAALDALSTSGQVENSRLKLAKAVEAAALDILRRRKPDRPLQTNVEFYTALLLDSLGFERSMFTCVFAIGRIAGWIAHAREQTLTGRLIRPQSLYIGPTPLPPNEANIER